MLPFIEVRHLPESSSFYSTITQPLGLRYISTADSNLAPFGSPSIVYGFATSPPTPVFELRQVKSTSERPLKLSRTVFSAASPGVVRRFQQRAKEADWRALFDDGRSLLSPSLGLESPNITDDWGSSVKATETDLDGNTMDVVYNPTPTCPEGYAGSTIRKTSSSEGEISRIMTWNYDVAASDVSRRDAMAPFSPATPSTVSRRSDAFPEDDVRPVLRRTVTTTSTTFLPAEATSSPRQNSSGLTAGAVVGTLLGVAAASAAIGAGVAYGAMKHERLRSEAEPPPFQRRSTFPVPMGARTQYSEYGAPRDFQSGADRRPPPTLVTRYSSSQSPRDGDRVYDDTRSRHSSRIKPSGASTIRTPSEASSNQKPLLLTGAEHGSYISASSKHSARTSEMDDVVVAPRSQAPATSQVPSIAGGSRYKDDAAAPASRRSSRYDGGAADRDSYVSSRSQRTASTVRGPGTMQAKAQTELASLASRPKTTAAAASRVSRRADSYASAREAPASRVSARRVALPMSGVGSSKAGYEREDDLCSIAPSDSISCIGINRKG
ncbi:unnamed protein product [Discula destructiva]